MAEKEERIRIEQFEYEGFGHCGGFSTDGEGYYCEFGEESIPITKEICEKKCPYDSSISRQEAIERIAKGICQFEMMTVMHVCKDCDEECFEHLELEVVDKAEAALNALLEGK